HPVDMDKVLELAKKYNLYVIEDATEALGSEYKGKKVGTLGDIGCFSFNGNKLITTGAGGMLVTNNEEWGKRAKYLSTQTKTTLENGAFYHDEIGYNFRMPNILAAMGVAQLEKAEEYLKAKIKHAKLYNETLKDVKGITIPVEKENAKNCFWLYSILVEEEYGKTRDEVMLKLKENGVQSRPFFQPVHLMPPYKNCKHGDMSVTNEIVEKGINLPSSVELSLDDIRKICDIIEET
ncbi:MAG TPA: DegT/DnrJ/EryC1/StrS family aminotransferase, partial [Clostridium sp.]